MLTKSNRCAMTTILICLLNVLWTNSISAEDILRSEFLNKFEVLLEEQRQELDIPGATAAYVLPDGKVVGVASGFADRELGLTMKPETRMFAGSTGKTYAAALMMSMVAAGEISLDDKLFKYLGDEEWYSRLPNANTVTIRHLLNHSSGIDRHVRTEKYGELVRERVTHDPRYWTPPRELVAFILDDEPLFPAGEGYNYADTNFLLAGIVMEKVGGFKLEHEIVRRLLYPHGLVLTGPQEGIWHPGLAQGYFPADSELANELKTALDNGLYRWNPLNEWTGGGFISNSMELAQWAKILYEGKAFDAPYIDDMIGLVNTHSKPEGYEYGIGVVVEHNKKHGLILRHAGIYFGYGTSMAYFADHKISVAVQVNTMNSDTAKAIRGDLAPVVLEFCMKNKNLCNG